MPVPEDFLGPQALEVSADGIQAAEGGVDTQGTEHVLGVHPVKVEGDSGDIFPVARLVVPSGLTYNRTLWVQSPQ